MYYCGQNILGCLLMDESIGIIKVCIAKLVKLCIEVGLQVVATIQRAWKNLPYFTYTADHWIVSFVCLESSGIGKVSWTAHDFLATYLLVPPAVPLTIMINMDGQADGQLQAARCLLTLEANQALLNTWSWDVRGNKRPRQRSLLHSRFTTLHGRLHFFFMYDTRGYSTCLSLILIDIAYVAYARGLCCVHLSKFSRLKSSLLLAVETKAG